MTAPKIDISDFPNISDKAKQAITNINDAFEEAQLMIDSAEYWARFAQGLPPKGMAFEYLGIVHGSEYVISEADYKARRKLLDKHYQSEKFTRSTNDNGEVVVTINVPTRENKGG